MNNYLTIAISEKGRNTYKVITVGAEDGQVYALDIREDEFINTDGSTAWDLFGLTQTTLNKVSEGTYIPSSKSQVIRYYDKNEIIAIFEKNLDSLETFMSRNKSGKYNYSIIKVDKVSNLSPPKYKYNERLQQKISIISNGYEAKEILNKDYKWISYWQNLPYDQVAEKLEYWKQFLNRKESSVYVILHIMSFKNGDTQKWISGFHCL